VGFEEHTASVTGFRLGPKCARWGRN
jgi:hypothetical protein